MLKLMKYEFRKTQFSKLILLLLTGIAEITFLAGVILEKGQSKWTAAGITLLMLCAVIGIAYIGLESVITLHRDLNTKQSYMLFLTPKNSYEILGAKILENGLSILITGIFFALLAILDAAVSVLYIGGLKDLMEMVNSFLDVTIHMELKPVTMLIGFFCVLANWMMYIVNADLAVILSATVLSGKRGSGIAAFVIYLLLMYVIGKVIDLLPELSYIEETLILYSAAALVMAALLYLVSGWIMEKKLSV